MDVKHYTPLHTIYPPLTPLYTHTLHTHTTPSATHPPLPPTTTHICGSDVPTTAAEAFSECSHHDINVSRVHPPVLHHTTTCFSYGTYAVCFIKIKVCLWRDRGGGEGRGRGRGGGGGRRGEGERRGEGIKDRLSKVHVSTNIYPG